LNQDDYDALEDGVIVGRIFRSQSRRRIGNGCGRAVTTET